MQYTIFEVKKANRLEKNLTKYCADARMQLMAG